MAEIKTERLDSYLRLIDISRLQAVARGQTERASTKIYIGGGMYSKPHTEQDAREGEDHAEFPSWDPVYSIGVDIIDRQHQKLFDISNRFYAAWRQRVRGAALSRIFDELLEYTSYHFAEEERLMQQIDYPALSQHRANHEELVELVNHYRTQLKRRVPGAEKQALEFVRTWLRAHVLDADKDIGVYIAGKKHPTAGQG